MKSEGIRSQSSRSGQKIVRAIVQPVVLWLALGCILGAGIALSWNPTPLAHALAAIFVACALVHAGAFYGPRRAVALFVVCLAITFAMENLGAATGFPFGNYHFVTDLGLPRIGRIPVIVGPLWFAAGYFSWIVASILLDGADRRLDRTPDFITLPVVAAFVMTQWDLVMDRSESTIAKAWIWHDGGGDFGVPLSNYLGWLLTSWLLFQAFALCLRGAPIPPAATHSRKLQAIAILFYVSLGLTHAVAWATESSGEVVDAAGKVWQIHDVREATVAIMLFTVLFSALLAALRLLRQYR